MSGLDLREGWADLLSRRPALAAALEVYGRLIEHWALAPVAEVPRAWTAEECRAWWARGVPLLAEARPALDAADLEDSLSQAMELVASVRPDATPGLRRLAEAWDSGAVTPAALFPARGRIAALDDTVGLGAGLAAFLAVACLRPALEVHLAGARPHLGDGDWTLGVCPFCGGPPAFGDVLEDGRRRLACHLCGGAWVFSRLRCPACGNEDSRTLARLEPEAGDEGYFVSTCSACRAYLKELDRRVRWNGGPALLEDWGSPHFDLAAERAGYWRPAPPLILTGRASGAS